jgi:hypothetical protein
MLRRFVLLALLSPLTLAGCASSAPDEQAAAPPIVLPPGSRMIAAGQFDKLVLSAPQGGTLYFVDDRTGDVVYTLPYPPNEDPIRLSEAPEAFRSIFNTSRRYRIYLASVQP